MRASFDKNFCYRQILVHLQVTRQWMRTVSSSVIKRLDYTTARDRKVIAITGSVFLHWALLLLLLNARTDLSASMGAVAGRGEVNGVGIVVTLVDGSKLISQNTLRPQTSSVQSNQTAEAAVLLEDMDEVKPMVKSEQTTEAAVQSKNAPSIRSVNFVGQVTSKMAATATVDAFGQNGQSNLDLWNAIAPCWNRIASGSTLPATLKVTFDANGGLALPPEIEREPEASITDESLKSEAQALQALSECGAYPMAQGQQNVMVKFPIPEQIPVDVANRSGQMAVVQR
jgi:hypothetical protein